jgi:hypothetical protein
MLPGITDGFSQVLTSAMTWFPTSVTLSSPKQEKNKVSRLSLFFNTGD